MKELFSFAWKVFFASWIGFLFLDVLRPGFVSDVFFVHWFLLAAGVCAGVTLSSPDPSMAGGVDRSDSSPDMGRKGGGRIGVILAGAILNLFVWRGGEVFGDLRIFLAMLAFVLPWLLFHVLYD